MARNPFQPTKFEWERQPSIWLSSRAKTLLETEKPDFVVGTRGSGKTTVLRSLHTKQILQNPTLDRQYRMKRYKWFGCYLQFNHNFQFFTDQIVSRAREDHGSISDLDRYKVFCSYFELSLLHSILGELRALEDGRQLHFSGRKEAAACKELRAMFHGMGTADAHRVDDYNDAARLVRALRGAFLAAYDRRRQDDVGQIIDSAPPTSIIHYIKDFILPSIECSRLRSQGLELYILLDDCESLNQVQQMSLNTYLKSTEGVAKWVIAHIRGQYDTTGTFIPDTSLSHADRNIRPVDELSDTDFQVFCESVASMRIRGLLSKNTEKVVSEEASFSLDSLGSFSYNTLVDDALGGYQSKEVKAFKDATSKTKNALQQLLPVNMHERFNVSRPRMPYVEHAVITLSNISLSNFADERLHERLKKELHRKEAAGFVAACLLAGREPVYAGKRFVIWAADGNIRDFLDIMAQMFMRRISGGTPGDPSQESLAKACRRFLNPTEQYSIQFQHRVLREVSENSLQSIELLQDSTEPQIFRFLNGLCELQKLLQRSVAKGDALATPERGIFVVDGDQFDRLAKSTAIGSFGKLLRRIERDGFIRLHDSQATEGRRDTSFRLHKRLAPSLGSSPRGAYEKVRLPADAVLRLMLAEDSSSELWAKSIQRALDAGDDRQTSLGFWD